MDMKWFFATFAGVFLAELGDKTQLATMAYSADPGATKWGVFIAAASALVLSSAIAVFAGGVLGRYISPKMLNTLAGAGFLIIGAWMLWKTHSAG